MTAVQKPGVDVLGTVLSKKLDVCATLEVYRVVFYLLNSCFLVIQVNCNLDVVLRNLQIRF